MLFAEFIVRRVGIRVPPQPELLNEGLALLIVAQAFECLTFLVRNDVGDILIQPRPISGLDLLPKFLLGLELFLIRARTL